MLCSKCRLALEMKVSLVCQLREIAGYVICFSEVSLSLK